MLKQIFSTKLYDRYHSDQLGGDVLGELRYADGNFYRLLRSIAATAIASGAPALLSATLAANVLKYALLPNAAANEEYALAGVFNQMGQGNGSGEPLTAVGASSIAGTSATGDCAWICVDGLVLSAIITGSIDGAWTTLVPHTAAGEQALIGTHISTGMLIKNYALSIETYGTLTGDVIVHCL